MAPQDPAWSVQELKLLNTRDIFIHKPAIMKKAEGQLQQLNETLQEYLNENPETCPPETDTTRGQIARGENHKGFPFLSLDMPQLFSKEQFFTFRTLFWWGHYLGFSLILKGEALEPLARTLAARTETMGNGDILFSITPTPWEWATTEDCHLPLDQINGREILSHWNTHGYLKLLRVYPMAEKDFNGLDWSARGLESFREFICLVKE